MGQVRGLLPSGYRWLSWAGHTKMKRRLFVVLGACAGECLAAAKDRKGVQGLKCSQAWGVRRCSTRRSKAGWICWHMELFELAILALVTIATGRGGGDPLRQGIQLLGYDPDQGKKGRQPTGGCYGRGARPNKEEAGVLAGSGVGCAGCCGAAEGVGHGRRSRVWDGGCY